MCMKCANTSPGNSGDTSTPQPTSVLHDFTVPRTTPTSTALIVRCGRACSSRIAVATRGRVAGRPKSGSQRDSHDAPVVGDGARWFGEEVERAIVEDRLAGGEVAVELAP